MATTIQKQDAGLGLQCNTVLANYLQFVLTDPQKNINVEMMNTTEQLRKIKLQLYGLPRENINWYVSIGNVVRDINL